MVVWCLSGAAWAAGDADRRLTHAGREPTHPFRTARRRPPCRACGWTRPIAAARLSNASLAALNLRPAFRLVTLVIEWAPISGTRMIARAAANGGDPLRRLLGAFPCSGGGATSALSNRGSAFSPAGLNQCRTSPLTLPPFHESVWSYMPCHTELWRLATMACLDQSGNSPYHLPTFS